MSVASSANSIVGGLPVIGNVASILSGGVGLIGSLFGGKPQTAKDLAYHINSKEANMREIVATGKSQGVTGVSRAQAQQWLDEREIWLYKCMADLLDNPSLKDSSGEYYVAYTNLVNNKIIGSPAGEKSVREQAQRLTGGYNYQVVGNVSTPVQQYAATNPITGSITVSTGTPTTNEVATKYITFAVIGLLFAYVASLIIKK